MDYCKYHPLEGATYFCHNCHIHQCDKCVDDAPNHRGETRCFLCGAVLESLGSGNTVEPFWRRLKEAFKYPINASSLSLIVGMSLVSALTMLIPFFVILAIFLYLFAVGAQLKYSFTCLERTAMGEMKAPDVAEAYQGGIKLLFQLVLITIVVSAVVGAAANYLGIVAGGLLGVIAVVSFPAIIIRLAQTQSALEALNPFQALAIIGAIGLPYGLLIAFIMMMMTSVAVLHEWIDAIVPAASFVLQMIVSNYYTVVVFHLMGYMLFQYQGRLGYSARIEADDEDELPLRTDVERNLAHIEVLLKEGEYEQMVDLYYRMFKQFSSEQQFYDKYFELLYACKKTTLMADFAGLYLEFMLKKKRYDKITTVFRQILLVVPGFVPVNPELRLQIARLFVQQNDNKLAIKLLNGMHKQCPDSPVVVDAYQLMAGLLEDTPGMQVQAQKCRQLVEQLKRKAAEKAVAPAPVPANQMSSDRLKGVKPVKPASPASRSSGLTLELVPMDLTPPKKAEYE